MESQTAYDAPGDADLEALLEAKDQEISRLLGVLREQATVLETLKTRETTTTAQAQETQSKLQQELTQITAEADKARSLAYTHQQEASRLITIQTALEERNKHLVEGLDSLHKQYAEGHGAHHASQDELKSIVAALTERIRVLEQLAQTEIQANTRSTEKAEQLTSTILQQHEQQTRRLDAIVDQLMALINSRFVRWPLIAKTWLTSSPKRK